MTRSSRTGTAPFAELVALTVRALLAVAFMGVVASMLQFVHDAGFLGYYSLVVMAAAAGVVAVVAACLAPYPDDSTAN